MSKEIKQVEVFQTLSDKEKILELEQIHQKQLERESDERWERWKREGQDRANKDRALFALLGSRSVMEAARNSGIARGTFYNYMKDPDFRIAFDDLQKEQRYRLEDDLYDLSMKATDFLRELYDRPKEEHGTKLDPDYEAKIKASFRILDYTIRLQAGPQPEVKGTEITATAKIPENTNAIAGAFVMAEGKTS